jgi:ribosomal protein L34E
MRKIHVRIPSGKAIHYKRRVKVKKHNCAISGAKLQSVNSKRGIAASNRRPNRKFGGNLSSQESSRVIKFASRVKEGAIKLEDVDVRLQSHVKGLLGKK